MLFCLLADQSSNKIKIEYEKDGKSSIDKNVGISNGKYYKYFELYYRDIIDIIEEKIETTVKIPADLTQSVVLPAVVKPVAFKLAESVVVKSAEVVKVPETPKKKQD